MTTNWHSSVFPLSFLVCILQHVPLVVMAVCQISLEVDWKKEWVLVKKQVSPGVELEDAGSRQHQPLSLWSFSQPLWKKHKSNWRQSKINIAYVLIFVCQVAMGSNFGQGLRIIGKLSEFNYSCNFGFISFIFFWKWHIKSMTSTLGHYCSIPFSKLQFSMISNNNY